MKSVIAISIMALFVAVAFQNCGPSPIADSSGPDSDQKVIVEADAKSFLQVKFLTRQDDKYEMIEIDRNSKQLKMTRVDQSQEICELNEQDSAELASILNGASICSPGPLPEGTAVCMAIGMEDIELTDETGNKSWLRPVICNNGRYLCDDKDKALRALLKEISC